MTEQSPADRINRASNEIFDATSFLSGTNAAFLEALYAQYLSNPASVDADWQAYFASLGEQGLSPTQLGRGPAWRRDARPKPAKDEITSALSGQIAAPAAAKSAPGKPAAADGRMPASARRIPSAPSSWCAPIASSAISKPISIP